MKDELFASRARTEGEERKRLWRSAAQGRPGSYAYQQKTGRVIPVVVLERSS